MKLILLLVFIAFDLTSTIFLSQTEPSTRSNLNSPLRLIALTKSGTDYKKREFTSQTWYIKNVSARDVQLPLPKDRFQPKAKPVNFFLFRARVSGGWTSGGLADHEVNYKADWVKVPANKKYELFTTTFYKEDEMYKEVEVCLSYRDEEGNISKERLTWLAATLPSNKGMHRSLAACLAW